MDRPQDIHWISLKRMLRYLAGTQTMGIILKSTNDFNISAYCDTDWATYTVDRCSHTGYMVYLGDSLITWCSKKQNIVSRSSTESEFRAIA